MAPSRDRRPGFSRRAQYGLFFTYILAIAGAVVGAVLLVLSRFDPPAFAALRSGAATITAPASSALAAGVRGIAAVPQTIGTHFRIRDENARLRATLARERTGMMRARALSYENLRLRRVLAVRDGGDGLGGGQVVATARIVSSTPSSTRRFGILNAGIWAGVRGGQPVRGPNGLIGRVVEVGPATARVLLLIDPESIVPVRRTRDGRAALASGRGDGLLDIRGVEPGNMGLRTGDLFVTSGTGGLYVPGVPVATVVRRTRDVAIGKPVASPAALDFAIVHRAFLPPPAPQSPAPQSPTAQPGAAVPQGAE